MCGRRNADLVQSKYPLDIVQKVANEVGRVVKRKGQKYFYFYFAGLGEPLLNNDLPDMFDHIKQECPSAKINFFSNFTKYNKKSYESILKNCNLVNVSLNAPNKNEYIELNGVDAFDNVIDNLKKLLELNRVDKYNNKIQVQIYKTPENEGSIKEFVSKSHELGIKDEELYIKSHLHNWGGYLDTKINNGKIHNFRNPCIYPWHNLYIDPLGNVYPCLVGCFKKKESNLYLGNVHETSIRDIYRNPQIKRLRREHRMCEWGKSFPECRDCDLYTNSATKHYFLYNYLNFNRLWKWL